MYTLIFALLLFTNPHLDAGFLVGRVSDESATVSIRPTVEIDAMIAWGTSQVYSHSLGPFIGLEATKFYEVDMRGLQPDRLYYFQIATRLDASSPWELSEIGEFNTARSPGSSFRVAIQSDEHLWNAMLLMNQRNLDLYDVTLSNIATSGADFRVSLGDFANCECYQGTDIINVEQGIFRYMAQRKAMEEANRTGGFYLAIGNHEGEQGWESIKDIAYGARKLCIPNPESDGFYTAGPRQNYFAWEWGDACFIVLDPFTNTVNKPHLRGPEPYTLNGWDWTLGKEQYDWLYAVLTGTEARWKVVMTHHLTTTTGPAVAGLVAYYGEGGIEVSKYVVEGYESYEWGGEDEYGVDSYAVERPGWVHGPIHDMLVNAGDVIVLHGHDHFFGWQELDGVPYILCPRPADADYQIPIHKKASGGYENGIFLPNSGHLTLDISTFKVIVRYWRSFLPGEGPNNSIAFERFIN